MPGGKRVGLHYKDFRGWAVGKVVDLLGNSRAGFAKKVRPRTQYRKFGQGGKLLYRQPAYLLCTDSTLAVAQVVQEYLWRWDIEVNFREEKTLLGVGQAQVRAPAAVEGVPALAVGAYALLHLAALATYGDTGQPEAVPLPRWRQRQPPARATTGRLINQLRYELWAQALRPESFGGFEAASPPDQKPGKLPPQLASALFYATN